MAFFTKRSYQKELLDRDVIPFPDIARNMYELDVINRRLGGHRITQKGVKLLLKSSTLNHRPIHIVEIGCGGGDNLKAINVWAKKNKLPVMLTGIDINPECIAYAKAQKKNESITFIQSDYKDAAFPVKPDIVFSSLFCHHFTDEELVEQLQWMQENSATGFFINDLHRHPLAYYSIKLLTAVFSKSYLVRNDAPLSVLRGFQKRDWMALFQKAGIRDARCTWQWAFRWLIICRTHAHAAAI
ncbi:methyltransferase domain-containing protein [Flavisolibacter sp. BT320]|nr:methyltransferase domain-containing protein [Flavisolibacter longurius]